MKTAAWAQLRANTPRLVAASVAIILSVGFVVGTLALSSAFNKTVSKAMAAPLQHATAVVEPEDHPAQTVDAARSADGVTSAEAVKKSFPNVRVDGHRNYAEVTALPGKDVRWQKLANGQWPSSPKQMTLDKSSADNFNVHIGDRITVMQHVVDKKHQSVHKVGHRVTVSGITDTSGSVMNAGMVTATMTDAGLDRIDDDPTIGQILVTSDSSGATTARSVEHALDSAGIDANVQTHDEAVSEAVAHATGNGDVLTMVVLVFATISLFVAAIVIANTFQVLIVQRTRELALLRCVGASKSQVRRSIYLEALVTGLVASALGVLAGYGLAAGVAAFSRSASAGIHLQEPALNPMHIGIGLIAGVVVTLAAAIVPARRATRVSPLEALRPLAAATAKSRAGAVRLVIAGVLMVAGAALLVLGATGAGLIAGLPGGVICFVGILLASHVLVPAAVRAVGSLIGFTGVPGKLAAANAVRNPGRTATTAAALLIGVTLVATVLVGATSVRQSLVDKVNDERPIDLVVSTSADDGLSPKQTAQVRGTDDVQGAIVLHGSQEKTPHGRVDVLGVPTDEIDSVVHADTLTPSSSHVIVNADTAKRLGVEEGQTLQVGSGSKQFTVTVASQAPDDSALVTASALETMDSQAPARQMWVNIDSSLSAAQIQELSSDISDDIPQSKVGGGAAERAAYGEIIDTMMLVVIGLLAIAVVIALVGVGNTLALSVLERRRESALLRAMGLTKAQLRGMLGLESVLVATVAALLGIGFGVFFGWAGTGAIVSQADLAETLRIPWGDFGLIVAIAIAAGIVASVLPARRATKPSPVEGMRME